MQKVAQRVTEQTRDLGLAAAGREAQEEVDERVQQLEEQVAQAKAQLEVVGEA